MRTLVVGGSGFVGRYLVRHFDAVGTSGRGRDGFPKLDITRRQEVERLFERFRPELVINAAAMTNVDECERRREEAFMINADGVMNISEAAYRVKAKLVQISTDYVFDGAKGDYGEDDPTNPVNVYGSSKLRGELYALERDALVLRISSPFGINLGRGKESFFEYVLRALAGGERVKALVDQITTPTFVEDVPEAIDALVQRGSAGTFHLAVREAISRYEFAIKVAEFAGFEPGRVDRITSREMNFYARRPRDTSMKTDKISGSFRTTELSKALKDLVTAATKHISDHRLI